MVSRSGILGGVDVADVAERTLIGALKPSGFRKRGLNWFRTTSESDYQVVNLQRSPWGGGDCYLNLGWDPHVPAGQFRPAHQCLLTLRAEHTDVIPAIEWLRPDGETTVDLPGISLLDVETSRRMGEDEFSVMLREVVAVPVAELMNRSRSVVDLVPLLTGKPWLAGLSLRDYLTRHGYELPAHNRA